MLARKKQIEIKTTHLKGSLEQKKQNESSEKLGESRD